MSDDAEIAADNIVRNEGMKQVIGFAGTGLAAGAGLAGVQHLLDLYRRNNATARPGSKPHVLKVPYKVADTPTTPTTPTTPAVPATPVVPGAEPLLDRTATAIRKTLSMHNEGKWNTAKATFMGENARTPLEQPWLSWAMPMAAVGGGVLGYRGISDLLSQAKTREQESELEASKERYERLLSSTAPHLKAAAASIDTRLDRLYDTIVANQETIEKRATLHEIPAVLLGGGLAALTGVALAGGRITSDFLDSRSTQDVTMRAAKERKARLYADSPPPFYIVPTQVDADGNPLRRHPQLDHKKSASTLGDGMLAAVARQKQRQAATQAQIRQMTGQVEPEPAKPVKAVDQAPPLPPPMPTVAGMRS